MWIDAHNHLQSPKLAEIDFGTLPIAAAVVNGTTQADWSRVQALAQKFPWIHPAYGLHPWFLDQRTSDWLTELERFLQDPRASIGEIGLDRWMENPDLAAQDDVFRQQLSLAATLDRPVSIHCLQATGRLLEILRTHPLPACGFLLHAFSGSLEVARECLDLGAYFSFSGYFLHERKHKQRHVFAELPLDRLLVETDAPAMLPPERNIRISLLSGANHPANIIACYEGLAALRKMPVPTLADAVQENFQRLFGG